MRATAILRKMLSCITTDPASTLVFFHLFSKLIMDFIDYHHGNVSTQANRPRSIYQYSNMAPRLSGQTSIFGVAFFVSKSLLGIERQKKLKKFTIFTRKPRSHVRILIYRTWPIGPSSQSLYPVSIL